MEREEADRLYILRPPRYADEAGSIRIFPPLLSIHSAAYSHNSNVKSPNECSCGEGAKNKQASFEAIVAMYTSPSQSLVKKYSFQQSHLPNRQINREEAVRKPQDQDRKIN